jgi:hypothetical protein
MRVKMMLLTVAAGFLAGIAVAKQPGPVILNLGPVVPTPVPSPKYEEHIRMISSFTLGNKPDGESVITFEATDFGLSKSGDDQKYRIIASEQYSLVEPKPVVKDLRDEIMRKIRDLESDMLHYVELTGPPRVREPLNAPSGAARPY